MTGALDSIDLDALAAKVAPALRGRVVWRQGKYRYRVRNALGKPVEAAAVVAIVATALPPGPPLQTELVARYIVGSDAFKEALG
ncbi:hypothetical protein [Microbacterium sp. NPDC058389]|uniref:hypothetical protein n=1 Tax=Microbacterium sp. NPDC058389 TaxID=3346475 RepID=UPI003656ED4B